jgi:type I restriction enzyme S subunit
MQVREGYAQIGVTKIPDDWDQAHLGELFSFKNGLNKEKEFFGFGTPIVNYMDVFSNSVIYPSNLEGLVSLSKREIKNFDVRMGDVFFTRTSETTEEIGITSVMLEEPAETVFSGFVLRARPLNKKLDDGYKAYCFSSHSVRKQIISKASYTTRALTNGRILSQVLITFPPLPEQRAIAKALSDVDGLLAAQEKLITKKRDIKQAAMQQLLTGKNRLPGFSGEWQVKQLGNVCQIKTGKKDVNEGNAAGQYPFFTCAREHTFSDSFSFEGEAILIAGNGEVGNLNYINGKFEAYQRTYVLQDFTTHVSYLWHQMTASLAKSLGIGKIGSSIPYIKMENLVEFEFCYPIEVSEQIAIANILSDIDSELVTLEQQRDKIRAIKAGMMQELLSGRIRLV